MICSRGSSALASEQPDAFQHLFPQSNIAPLQCLLLGDQGLSSLYMKSNCHLQIAYLTEKAVSRKNRRVRKKISFSRL